MCRLLLAGALEELRDLFELLDHAPAIEIHDGRGVPRARHDAGSGGGGRGWGRRAVAGGGRLEEWRLRRRRLARRGLGLVRRLLRGRLALLGDRRRRRETVVEAPLGDL